MKSVFRGIFLLALFAAGCGETPIPTSATSRSLFSQELGGLWLGDLKLSGVADGECVGADLRAVISGADPDTGVAPDSGTVTVTQTGAEMTAVVRSSTTGLSCSYSGSAGASLFALSAVSCDEKEVFFQCTDGQTRVLDLDGSTMTAFARGGEATGTVASSYNVSRIDDDGQKKPVARLTVQYRFEAERP
jgi:hypothetical protein